MFFSFEKYQNIYSTISELTGEKKHNLSFREMCNNYGIRQFILISDDYTNSFYVFDYNSNEIIEASLDCASPFDVTSTDNVVPIYVGAGEYYYICNDDVYNCKGSMIKKSNKKAIDIINKRYKNRLEQFTNYDLEKNYKKRLSAQPYQDYSITNEWFFRHCNFEYEYNNSNICGYISLALLLSYYDTFLNGNIIPDTLYHSSIGSFNTWNKKKSSNNGYKKDIAKWENGPNITLDFVNYLIEIDEETPNGSLPNTCSNRVKTASHYFNSISLSNISLSYNYTRDKNNIISALKSDNPIILDANSYHYDVTTDEYMLVKIGEDDNINGYAHAFTCYGYRQLSDKFYYKVHTGYQNPLSSCLLIINDSITGYNVLNVKTSHIHSNNYIFDHGKTNHPMCPCMSSSNFYTYLYCGVDLIKCTICNTSFHDPCDCYCFVAGNNNHVKKCINCNHQVGFESHNLIYVNSTKLSHRLICIECGFEVSEVHKPDSNNPNKCIVCGKDI